MAVLRLLSSQLPLLLLGCRFSRPAPAAAEAAPSPVGGWSSSLVASTHSLSSDRATGAGVHDAVASKTYLAWAGPGMDPTVAEFDHVAEGYLAPPRAVGGGKDDDHHNYPKMILTGDGTLLVVWTDHNRALYMSRCSRPRTVECAWNETKINDDKGTYPTIHRTDGDGHLYVFYRHTSGNPTDYRPLHYVKSVDDGYSWSPPQRAIDTSNLMPDNLNEVYSDGLRHEPAHAGNGHEERFLLGWTMAGGGLIHKHNIYHKNVYFVYFYPGSDEFRSVDGANLGRTVDHQDMDACLVVDSGPLDAAEPKIVDYYFAPSYTDAGHPILVYKLDGLQTCAAWDGSSWDHTPLGGAGGLFDIEKVGPTAFDVYHLHSGSLRVKSTVDGGRTWTETGSVPKPPEGVTGKGFGKIFKIPNAHPDVELLALENDFDEKDFTGKYAVWTIGSGFFPPAPSPTPAPTASYQILVRDDFDAYAVGDAPGGGWEVDDAGGTSGTVVMAAIPGTLDRSVELRDTTTLENVGLSHSFPAQTGIVTAEFEVMMPAVSNSFNIALSGSGGTAVSVFARNDAFRYKIGSDYHYLQPMVDGVWYRVALVADVRTRKCDIFVDGVLRGDQTSFRYDAVTDISKLRVATSNGNEQVGYFDNAEVYVGTKSSSPPPTAIPSPTPLTNLPTAGPTRKPTSEPSEQPTKSPTDAPTDSPSKRTTLEPTGAPTDEPTKSPTDAPTRLPTDSPIHSPTAPPTQTQGPPSSSQTTVVDDDFNSYVSGSSPGGGWTTDVAGGTVTIAAVPNSSNKSVKLSDTTTSENVSVGHSFQPQTGLVTAEFKVMMPTVSSSFNIALSGSGGTAVSIFARNDQFAYKIGSTYHYLQEMSDGVWYHVKLVANVSTQKCDIYIDGIPRGNQVDFRYDTVSDISSLRAATSNANAQVGYFDDAKVVVEPAPTQAPTPVPLVEDTFNEYATGGPPGGGWTTDTAGGAGGTVVIAAIPNAFDRSVELRDTTTSENVGCSHSFLAQTGIVTAEFRVMMPAVSNSFNIALSGSGGTAVSIFARNDQFAYKIGSNYYYLQSMGDGVWYNVKLVANLHTMKCDIYIDGVLQGDQTDFRYDTVSDISKFRMATSNGNRQVGYFDEVKITNS